VEGHSVEWDAYLAGLSAQDRTRAERIAEEYGPEAASRLVRYQLVSSPGELEAALRRGRRRVRARVRGLYESIDTSRVPAGWTVANDIQREADGTLVARTDVAGPNGATGFFERGYNARDRRVDLRNAFLRLNGMTEELPAWVTGVGTPMVATRGTPTVQYFTLYQFRLLGVPAGRVRWWRRLLHRTRLRAGPFAAPGLVTSVKMSTIQNVEVIVHLHWLRRRHPAADLSDLVAHTASVDYAETTVVQCGYRLAGTRYVAAGEWENEIGVLLAHFEAGNPTRAAEHDDLLARFSFDRGTVMKQNFDIELSVVPE
jgi:hypothetical protein